MVGTKEGGKKAALTNLSLYGNEFYKKNGRKGGKKAAELAKRTGRLMGFAAMDPQRCRACAARGGRISRRGPAKKIAVE